MDTELMHEFLAKELFGNTVHAYLVAAGIFIGVLVGAWLVKHVVVHQIHRFTKSTATDIDDFFVGLLRRIGPLIYVVAGLYVASRSLRLAASVDHILQVLFIVVVTTRAIQLLQAIVVFFLTRWAASRAESNRTAALVVNNMTILVRIVLWSAAVLFILDNIGINITAAVAGLGVGGVAVALAAQAVLGDAFSAFAIFIDRPFEVGDFIIVGDLLGTVEHVGFKTTRIRSLGGEQLIFANSDLTSSRIKNYKRMQTRRIIFSLGVIYQTSLAHVREIPAILRAVIEEHDLAKFDRAHFQKYGDFALIFEAVYYVQSPDYNTYMDAQQFINVRIFEEFKRRGIEFAYPTQQIYHTQIAPPTPA